MEMTSFKQVSACEIESANDASMLHGPFIGNREMHSLHSDGESALSAQLSAECEGLPGAPSIEHSQVISYLFSWRHDNRMIHVSPAIANLGFARRLWLDEADFRLRHVHEDDFERVYLALQHSISTGDKFNCHYRLYDSSGNVRWFHDEASVKLDRAGMPIFLKGIMLDITDIKCMEAELDEHRYYIERKVEQRTESLKKQMALLESCNAALCKKLELAQAASIPPHELASLQTDHAVAAIETSSFDESLDGITEWVRNTFGCRVAAAGSIA
jgi:hypothetical protein